MKIINKADREIHFVVMGAGSQTLWEADLSQGASVEKPISGSIMYLATTFEAPPPPLHGETLSPLTGQDTVTINQVYCGARYSKG